MRVEDLMPANPPAQMKDTKLAASGRTTTILTAETEFNGTLGFSGDLEIYGRLEGAIESDNGLLTIGESALIKAEIKAQNIIILGKVQGDIMAVGRIELRGKAQIYGDIRSTRLLIEDGVTFVGRSESLNNAPQEKPDFNHIFTKIGAAPSQGSSASPTNEDKAKASHK